MEIIYRYDYFIYFERGINTYIIILQLYNLVTDENFNKHF